LYGKDRRHAANQPVARPHLLVLESRILRLPIEKEKTRTKRRGRVRNPTGRKSHRRRKRYFIDAVTPQPIQYLHQADTTGKGMDRGS
jgi:hypothetical protein